ncbi:MAG: hypothetical protein HYU36_15865 [Planctomycetes bacterium]|nr:hypothetical protein [Planctomycetota bacterium]
METFDDGPGGWIGWDARGASVPEIRDSAAISRSPWWVDFNHAPPGAGYLHLLYCLHTTARYYPQKMRDLGIPNRFCDGGFPVDFTGAKLTARLRGDLDPRGAHLVLLAQGKVGGITINSVLTAQPFRVTRDWSEQAITLEPDSKQWACLGSRHDRTETYGWGEIQGLLREVNCDIILVLFPLDIVPAVSIQGDPHRLRAGLEYPVDTARLPRGEVRLDEIRIEFAAP